jgi:hypothetical protein
MIKKSIFVLLFFNIFVSFCFAQVEKNESININDFHKTATLARKIWREIKPTSDLTNEHAFLRREMFENIKNLKSYPKICDNSTVEIVLTRFDKIQSFDNKILIIFHDYFPETNIIEWLEIFQISFNSYINEWYAIVRRYENSPYREYWNDFNECRVCLLPLLAKNRVDYHLHNTGTSVHLSTYPSSLEFESVGLYDLAWRIQMENEHRNFYVRYFSDTNKYHSNYIRAAQNAYRAGKKDIGWTFLMNAAVFEDEKSFDLAMEIAQLWIDVESGKKKLPELQILLGEERKKMFLEIVERYRTINVHPRAWLFIEENKKEFDNADELIKKLQDDWLTIINSLICDPEIKEIVMYGVELYPKKNDPLSIKIPWPFPDGSVEKVKKKIQKLADKIKEKEAAKDGLIDWYFADGRLAVKAKYISCNDENLIVERENGKKGKIEIAKLTDGGKNYVYRRLAIRNIAVEDFCTLFHKWNLADKKLADVEAKYLSLDQENKITLELKDGKKQVINLSDLNKTEQEYIKIWESWEAKKRAEEAEKLKEQERQLVELRKKLLSEVQFRDWQSRDEIFRIKAKYISHDLKQQSVKIEQENGKQITIELKDLCDTDRQYLHNLLNPKLPETKNK